MICPNINSPDWKALVKKHGENKAFQLFRENDNEIPKIINSEKQSLMSSIMGFFVSQGSTLQEINKNPELSSRVIDEIKKIFPDVVINKGGVVKEDGTFVPLSADQKGLHVRNALHSMVAWANDAYLETPPHEYAHHYIDMFRNAPIVQQAIEKYGEEKLVEKIGRYYTEQYTAPGFKLWVRRFWNMIRRIAGAPNIKYELYRAFRENKTLSPKVSKGTDIVRAQEPLKRTTTAYEESEELRNLMDSMYNMVDDVEVDSKGQYVKGHIRQESILEMLIYNPRLNNKSLVFHTDRLLNNVRDIENYSIEGIINDINVVKDFFREKVDELIAKDRDSSKNYKNVEGFDQNSDLANFKEMLLTEASKSNESVLYALYYLAAQENSSSAISIESYPWDRMFGTPTQYDIQEVQEKGIKIAEKYIAIQQRIYRSTQERNNIVLLGQSKIDLKSAVKLMADEINEASQKRKNYWYNKGFWGKNKIINAIIRKLIRFLTNYQSNARLQSKFLAGKANSIIEKVLYEEFNNARDKSLRVQDVARQFYGKAISDKKNINGSYFYNKTKTRDELKKEGGLYEIEVHGGKKIEVTEGELLAIYFNQRMEDNLQTMGLVKNKKGQSPAGFVIQDKIEGRIVDQQYNLSTENLAKIVSKVETNPRLQETVKNLEAALESMYEVLNKAHLAETGVELTKQEFYFPTRYGIRDESRSRNSLKNIDFIGQRYEKKGDIDTPIRISDAYEVVNNYIDNVAHYAGYNLPIKNARKVLKLLTEEFGKDKTRSDYKEIKGLLGALSANVNILEDNSNLFTGTADKKVQTWFNKVMANFSVAVLSLNVPTYFKQPISYLAAKEVINVKYLKEAGWGVGTIAGIKAKDVFKQLRKKKVFENKSIFPYEWHLDESDPLYKIIVEYSAILKERFQGGINRELGETLMDSRISEDMVRIPFTGFVRKFFGDKNDSDFEFSKNAMMAGIKAFDTATVISIWKAVELEAQDPNGDYANKDGSLKLNKNGTAEQKKAYYEHVARRTEEIVNKSQPTFDLNNRSAMASSKNSFARFLTMFGSARSKLAMLLIEGAVDYNNDKTPENAQKFLKRIVNIGVLSTAAIVAVDMLKQMTLGSGFDDEDDILPFAGWKSVSTIAGNFYGLGTVVDYITSNLDDEPWRRDIQHPAEAIAEDILDAVVYTAKGDFGKATINLVEGSFKATGTPMYPYVVGKNIIKRIND